MLIGFLSFSSINAQEVLVVAPGSGTLNDAIDEHGGDKIYQLQAGGWYGLSAIIENVDYHLQIIGEDYDDATLPATIQTGMTPESLPFGVMFDGKGDITLKNVYFVNADLNGQIPARFLMQSNVGGFVKIDNCIVDPMGQFSVVELNGGDNDLYVTNSIMARHGNMLGANDGHAFIINNAGAATGADSVLFENNTFIDMGMNWLSGNFAAHVTNFLKINHNTFVRSKSQLDWSIFENEYYLTNNLFFDFMTGAYAYHWQPMPGGDVEFPKPMLIYADTIPGETLPSTRTQFVEYNNMFHTQGAYDLITEMNDTAAATGANKVNIHPLIWDGLTDAKFGDDPAAAFAASREGHLFNHANNVNTDFPNWKYGNTTYDLDPEWTDQMIYDKSDDFIEWARPANFIHAMGQSAGAWPAISEWTQWHWDPDGDVSINDTWPLFDGTYSNPATLKGSIEVNVPLGDLNWFPDAKAAWEASYDDIWAHIQAGNEDQIDIGYIPVAIKGTLESDNLSVYPNPASDKLMVKGNVNATITIRNIIGQVVKSAINVTSISVSELPVGVYMVTLEEKNNISVQKVLISR